jgi:hypothetical protein
MRPAYAALLPDPGGRGVGVSRPKLDPGGTETSADLDAEGRLADRVWIPPLLRPSAITEDRLWGRDTDDLGVEYVVACLLEGVEPDT